MSPEEWFERLTAVLPGEPGGIGAAERDALLDLARIAAHTSERWTAPVSTFLAGVALADASAAQRVAALEQLIAALDDPDAAAG